MADKKISDLTAATSVADADLLLLELSGGNSRKITFANVKASLPATGSWTPVIAFGGASVGVTYSVQVGRYIRQGNVVTASCHITLTNNGSSTGSATITGLTFTAKNTTNYHQAAATGLALGTPTGKVITAFIAPNTTALSLVDVTNNALATEADIPDTCELIMTITYECEP